MTRRRYLLPDWLAAGKRYLVVPELSDLLVLHGGVAPDEVGRLVLVPGLEVAHLLDGYTNWRKRKRKTV